MFTIGELSKFTQLTVKTLRFYHEEGLLIPAFVDPDTGYRYYDQSHVETARTITYLRSLEFPLSEIRELLQREADEDLLDALEGRRAAIHQRIRELRQAALSLERFISEEKEARAMLQMTDDVHEKLLEPLLIAGIRMRGKYSACGTAFGRLGRSLGRSISGKPLLLHYDDEYREEGADFEACLPIRTPREIEGVSIRTLPGGRCVSLLHRGPYEQLGRSYAKAFDYIKAHKLSVISPTREVYLKGPGMIFRGNPKNYLTEIQIPIETEADAT